MKTHTQGTIDDIRQYINNTHVLVETAIRTKYIEIVMTVWEELLHFTGGELDISKCAPLIFNLELSLRWYSKDEFMI